jgi:hypothetical protein
VERFVMPASKNLHMNGLTLTWLLWERMLEEETQHFPRCVRSSRISVGARRAASRPCVSSSVDVPVLKDSAPTRVGMDRAGIGMPSRYPPAMHLLLRARRSHTTSLIQLVELLYFACSVLFLRFMATALSTSYVADLPNEYLLSNGRRICHLKLDSLGFSYLADR